MSSRQDFFNKLIRGPARHALYPHIRDITVDKKGRFIDAVTGERLSDPLRLDEAHMQKKLVLVNFFSTRDEAETHKMAKLAELLSYLGEHVGRDIFINSVTSDPEHDTVKRLAAFGEKLGVRHGWTLVRATPAAYQHVSSRMNRVRGYQTGREVFYGMAKGFWGTFPVNHHAPEVAQRLVDTLPQPKPTALRRAGPARLGEEKHSWGSRAV